MSGLRRLTLAGNEATFLSESVLKGDSRGVRLSGGLKCPMDWLYACRALEQGNRNLKVAGKKLRKRGREWL